MPPGGYARRFRGALPHLEIRRQRRCMEELTEGCHVPPTSYISSNHVVQVWKYGQGISLGSITRHTQRFFMRAGVAFEPSCRYASKKRRVASGSLRRTPDVFCSWKKDIGGRASLSDARGVRCCRGLLACASARRTDGARTA